MADPMASTGKVSRDGEKLTRQRRLPAGKRRAEMLRKAADHFAAYGFESSTRELAASLGVTQALIYKHFKSKDDLIEQTLDAVLGHAPDSRSVFAADASLGDAVSRYYKSFVSKATETRMRLFIRAGLDGRSWPTRRGNALTRNLFVPMVIALRASAGLSSLDAVPMMRGERELVMMLHASMVFLGIRRHVYGMPMPDNLDDVVDLYVRTFIAGAMPAIRDLHESGDQSLKVTLLADTPKSDRAQSTATGPKRTSSK